MSKNRPDLVRIIFIERNSSRFLPPIHGAGFAGVSAGFPVPVKGAVIRRSLAGLVPVKGVTNRYPLADLVPVDGFRILW